VRSLCQWHSVASHALFLTVRECLVGICSPDRIRRYVVVYSALSFMPKLRPPYRCQQSKALTVEWCVVFRGFLMTPWCVSGHCPRAQRIRARPQTIMAEHDQRTRRGAPAYGSNKQNKEKRYIGRAWNPLKTNELSRCHGAQFCRPTPTALACILYVGVCVGVCEGVSRLPARRITTLRYW
jgi:hypothetical protein